MNFADISAAARRERGVVTDVTVTSERGNELRIANPWSNAVAAVAGHRLPSRTLRGDVLTVPTAPGQELVLRAAMPAAG
ncbi:MAG TPA: hypothetical protein VK324_11230 [Tepidisphaeraceae bacterium]|nr:hypothetical protein [Tepidisphaeraceae bacterium]